LLPKRRVFSVFIGVTMEEVLEEVYEDSDSVIKMKHLAKRVGFKVMFFCARYEGVWGMEV
jgi:hypothetical protein